MLVFPRHIIMSVFMSKVVMHRFPVVRHITFHTHARAHILHRPRARTRHTPYPETTPGLGLGATVSAVGSFRVSQTAPGLMGTATTS